MNWLHNPIAEMVGRDFLLLYGCVILATLVSCWWTLRQYDGTGTLPDLAVPEHLDPDELAYLRGGAKEVARLNLVDLLAHGYLSLSEEGSGSSKKQMLSQKADHPGSELLSSVAQETFRSFSVPTTVHDFFQNAGVQDRVETHCQPWRQRCVDLELLAPRIRTWAGWVCGVVGVGVVVGLGGYKLWISLAKGRTNVAFLVILGLVGIFLMWHVCQSPWLSRRGRRYLTQLQAAFQSLKDDREEDGDLDGRLLFLVGLFGLDALDRTRYACYRELFAPGASAGGGWGGGCGSCGGGCGGGCGGCGGCGGGCG